MLGFIGAALVLGFDIGSSLPVFGVIASFIALLAITTSTLWQKKISNNLPLSVSNMYQAIGGCFLHIIIILIFSEPYINFTSNIFNSNESSNISCIIWCIYNINVFN